VTSLLSLSMRRFTRRSSLAWSLSSGERSARLRRLDWVSSAFATSLFEGVSSARLRRCDWFIRARWSGESLSSARLRRFDSFFRSLRRAASLCVVGMMGPSGRESREGTGKMSSLRHQTDRQTPHLLRYHLLGVLCWLYPVGTPEYSFNTLCITFMGF